MTSDRGGKERIFVRTSRLEAVLQNRGGLCAWFNALADLAKVEITSAELRSALVTGGSPVTVDDIRKRFEKLLAEHLKGKDEAKVRFVVVEGAN